MTYTLWWDKKYIYKYDQILIILLVERFEIFQIKCKDFLIFDKSRQVVGFGQNRFGKWSPFINFNK